MTHSKKHISPWRSGIFDICLGFLIFFYPLILLNSFLSAFLFIFVLSTISSFNTINMTKKNSSFSIFTHLSNYDECRSDKVLSRKNERKEFSLLKSVLTLLCTVLIYHLICILFGAPVFELHASTLYFSCLLTVLTVYPLLWFFYSCDSLSAVIRIFSDVKYDNYAESHFYSYAIYSIIGAWVGAFPIPLDWDRPWQEWPITCCIGASLGYATAHFFMGGKLLYSLFKEKKKLTRSV